MEDKGVNIEGVESARLFKVVQDQMTFAATKAIALADTGTLNINHDDCALGALVRVQALLLARMPALQDNPRRLRMVCEAVGKQILQQTVERQHRNSLAAQAAANKEGTDEIPRTG